MLRPFILAVLVSLIEVSCNLLQELEDEQVSLTRQPQPLQTWRPIEYSHQPRNYGTAPGSRFSSNVVPRPERNFFTASVSRETVDAPPLLQVPSSGGCAGNPDFFNFQGSPSMVFNPGAHVNFVIGVPEDYKMEISDAEDGWKIITITAPEGSDAINLEPNFLYGNGSSFPGAGLNGLPSSQYPFMKPLASGSPEGSEIPGTWSANRPRGPGDQNPDGIYPGYLVPGKGGFPSRMGPFGRYPDSAQYPRGLGSQSGPRKPGYGKPELQAPEMESYPSYPNGQYPYESPSPSAPGHDQPLSQSPGMYGFPRPGGQPGTRYNPQYSGNLMTPPETRIPGQLKFPRTYGPERHTEGSYPNDKIPLGTTDRGFSPAYRIPGTEYPNGHYPDNIHPSPGSRVPGIRSTYREPTDRRSPEDLTSPFGRIFPGYNQPGYQTPGTRKLPGMHQPSDRYPDGPQPDGMSPSGSVTPGYDKPLPQSPGTGRLGFIRPGGQTDAGPDDQYPDNVNFLKFPGSEQRPQEPFPRGYPDSPSGSLTPGYDKPLPQSPGTGRLGFIRPGGQTDVRPDDQYPDNVNFLKFPGSEQEPFQRGYPDSPSGSLTPGYDKPLPQSPGTGRLGFIRPGGQTDGRPDDQYPDNVNFLKFPGSEQEPFQRGYPDSPSGSLTPGYDKPLPQSPGTGRLGFIRPGGQTDGRPDDQYPDNVNFLKFPGSEQRQQEPFQRGYPDSPSGPLPLGYNVPGTQSPRVDKLSRPHQPYDRFPDGRQPDDMSIPSGPQHQLFKPGSQTPLGPSGRFPSFSGQPAMYPEGQFPDSMNLPQGSPMLEILGPYETFEREVVQPNDSNSPGLVQRRINTPEIRQHGPSDRYPGGPQPGGMNSPSGSLTPGYDKPLFLTPGTGRLGFIRPDTTNPLGTGFLDPRSPNAPGKERFSSPFGLHGSYPDGKYPDYLKNAPQQQAPGMRTPLSQYGMPDGEYPGVRRGPSEGSPEFINPAYQTPGSRRSPSHSDGMTGMYPDGQSPDNVNIHSNPLAPGYKQSPMTPDSGGIPSPSGLPGSYPRGQHPSDQISPSRSPEEIINEPGSQKPGMERYNQPRGPNVRFPEGYSGPLGSRFDEPISRVPEIGRPFKPDETYPASQSPDGKGPYSGSIPGFSMPELQTLKPVGVRSPSGYDRFPDGQYPGMVGEPRQDHVPGMHPDGQSLDYISDLPGSQSPKMGEPLRPNMLNRENIGDQQKPNDASSHLRFPSQGPIQPEQLSPESEGPSQRFPGGFNEPQGLNTLGTEKPFLLRGTPEKYPIGQYPEGGDRDSTHPLGPEYQPGMKEFPQPSSPLLRFSDGFNRPQGFQPVGTDKPFLLRGPTDKYPSGEYPYDIGGLLRFRQLLPGMKEFPQPGESSQRYPDGPDGPDNMSYPPGWQASSPQYPQGFLISGIERFPRPNGLHPEGQIQGRPGMLFEPVTRSQYPHFIPKVYRLEIQLPGTGKATVLQRRPSIQGSDVSLPDYVRQLLEPYTTLGDKTPSLNPSEAGRYPRPIGFHQDNQYPDRQYTSDDHYPDNVGNHPGPRFTRPGSQIPVEGGLFGPGEPSDRYPIDQPYQGPALRYRYLRIPSGAEQPHSGESDSKMDFPGGIQQDSQGQNSIQPTYGGSPHMNAPRPSSPDYGSSAPGRSPVGRETEPHSALNVGPQNMDGFEPSGDSPSGVTQPQTHREIPQSPENIGHIGGSYSRPMNYQDNSLVEGNQSPDNFRPVQDDSPGGRMSQDQNLYTTHTTGSRPHSPENGTPTNTAGGPESGPQGSQMRIITVGSPQGDQMRTVMSPQQSKNEDTQSGSMHPLNPSGTAMIMQYPQSSSMGAPGGSGVQSMGLDGSMKTIPSVTTKMYGSGSPQSNPAHTTYHSAFPISTTYYQSSPHNQQPGQSGTALSQPHLVGTRTYRIMPSSSFRTVYPAGNAQSGSRVLHSSPTLQYQQPRRTVVSSHPVSSSVVMPSYRQSYVQQPMNAVRSLDGD